MKLIQYLWVFIALLCNAATHNTPDNQTGSCTLEGVRYDNGNAIAVRDAPCVRCVCKLGVPECRVRMCPPLPDPPPRGCIIVHQRGACCANLKCSQGSEENITQIRDLLEAEKQKQQFLSSNRLRSDEPNDGTCIIGGTRYATGSALSSSSLCRHCFCVRGRERCVSPRCVLPAPGCRPVFRAPSCCPVKYDCREHVSNKTETDIIVSSRPGSKITVKNTKSKGCVVSGRRYTEGASIPAATRSPCESCFCLRGAVRCAHSRCAGPLDGCTPILAPGRCCPISYDCVGVSNITSTDESAGSKKNGTVWDNQIRSLGGPALIPSDNRSHREVSSTVFSAAQTPPTSSQVVTTVKAITASESRHVTIDKNITFLTTRVSAGVSVEANNSQTTQPTVLNQSRKKNEDYDYDYMSLPPSLPNLRIIPFVAADAVVATVKPQERRPQLGDSVEEGKIHRGEIQIKTEDPDIKFSPPRATEGGFEPRQPVLEGPFFQSKFAVPVFTASVNGPVVNSDSAVTNEEGSQTEKPNATEEIPADENTTTTETTKQIIKKGALCEVDGRSYRHGELVSSPSACELCVCHDGEVQCQPPLCGPAPDGCRRLARQDSCCGPILCAPTPMMAPNTHTKLPDDILVQGSTIPPSTTGNPNTNKASSANIRTTTESAQTTPSTTQSLTTLSSSSTTTSTTTTTTTASTTTTAVSTPTSTMTLSSTTPITRQTSSTAKPPKLKTRPKPPTTEINIVRESATTQTPTSSATPTSTSKKPPPTMSFLQALWGDTDNSEKKAQDKIDHSDEDPVPQTHQEDEDSEDSFSLDKVFELLFSSGEATTAKPKTTIKPPLTRINLTTTTMTPQYVTPLKTTTSAFSSTTAATFSTTDPVTSTTTTPRTTLPYVTRLSSSPKTTTTSLYVTRLPSSSKTTTLSYVTRLSSSPKPTTLSYVTQLSSSPKTTSVQFVTPTTSSAPKSTTTSTPSTTYTSTTQKLLPVVHFVTPTVSTEQKSTAHFTQSSSTSKIRPTQVINELIPETSTKPYFTSTTRRLFSPSRLSPTLYRSPQPITGLRFTTPRIPVLYTTTERTTTTLENFIPPPTRASLYGRPFAGSKPVQQSGSLNVLKLAGCNIYGRMYRVGRIIIELSGPCKECSCTEFGVQCRHLLC